MSTKRKKRYRIHPIMILTNLKSFFLLAIIPLLRGGISALRGDLSNWSSGIWVDILIFSSILLFSLFTWLRCRYDFNDDYIEEQSGLFFSQVVQIPWDNIMVFKVHQPLLYRLVGATILQADALGGNTTSLDIKLYLSRKQAEELLLFYRTRRDQGATVETYEPTILSRIALATLSANSLAGVILISTFISQSGKLLGDEFSKIIIESFETLARTLSKHIPPATAAIGYIIVIAWLLAVIMMLLRYYHYQVSRRNHTITLKGGLLSRQVHVIDEDQVYYLNIKQNVITFFAKRFSLYLSSLDSAKSNSDLNCLIPMQNSKKFQKYLSLLFPQYHLSEVQIRPNQRGYVRFFAPPAILILGFLSAMKLGILLIPRWTVFIRFTGLMALVPCVGFLLMRYIEFRNSGIGKSDGIYTLRYASGFTFETILVKEEKIVQIKIKQSILQRWISHNCDVRLYTVSDTSNAHVCRNVKYAEAMDYFPVVNLEQMAEASRIK